MNSNKLKGSLGESAAAEYLRKKRYRIVGMNYACRYGEIDLIAETREHIVFVEVKTRSSESTGLPEEAVTREKRRRYEEIALAYLRSSTLGSMYVRFDVASVTLAADGQTRTAESASSFELCDGEVWRVSARKMSCSDSMLR